MMPFQDSKMIVHVKCLQCKQWSEVKATKLFYENDMRTDSRYCQLCGTFIEQDLFARFFERDQYYQECEHIIEKRNERERLYVSIVFATDLLVIATLYVSKTMSGIHVLEYLFLPLFIFLFVILPIETFRKFIFGFIEKQIPHPIMPQTVVLFENELEEWDNKRS